MSDQAHIVTRGDVATLCRILEEAPRRAERARRVRVQWRIAALLVAVIAVVFLFSEFGAISAPLSAALGGDYRLFLESLSDGRLGHILLALAAVAVLAGAVIAFVALVPLQLDARKDTQGLRGFLERIERDVAPGPSIVLDCHLRDPLAPSLARQHVSPAAGNRGGRRLEGTVFRDDWLQVEATLRDGTTLRLRHRFESLRIVASRTNARGRRKEKTRYKARGAYDLSASFSARHWRQVAKAPPLGDASGAVEVRGERIRVRMRQSVKLASRDAAPRLDECEKEEEWMQLADKAFRHVCPRGTAGGAAEGASR